MQVVALLDRGDDGERFTEARTEPAERDDIARQRAASEWPAGPEISARANEYSNGGSTWNLS